MKLSARNQLKGKIVSVTKGATTSHVKVDIGQGVVVTSAITNEAVVESSIQDRRRCLGIVKASDVMIGKSSFRRCEIAGAYLSSALPCSYANSRTSSAGAIAKNSPADATPNIGAPSTSRSSPSSTRS